MQVEQRLGTSKGGIETLKAHDWFATAGLDWQRLLAKEVTTPGTPHAHAPPLPTICVVMFLLPRLDSARHLFAQANKRAAELVADLAAGLVGAAGGAVDPEGHGHHRPRLLPARRYALSSSFVLLWGSCG